MQKRCNFTHYSTKPNLVDIVIKLVGGKKERKKAHFYTKLKSWAQSLQQFQHHNLSHARLLIFSLCEGGSYREQ